MKVIIFLAAILVVVLGDAVSLTSADFDQTITGNEFVLAMFYAPWCGHCKTLKPNFNAAADQAQGRYTLAMIDCTVDEALCQKYQVKGYPTLYFFKNGNKKEYDGPRSTDGILNWLEKHSGPVSTHISTSEQLEEFISRGNAVVGYFSEDDGRLKTFNEAAEDEKSQELRFGYVTSAALFGENSEGAVKLHKKEGESVTVPEESLSEGSKLAAFLFEHSFPVVGEVGPENFKHYVSRGKPLYLAFINVDQPTKAEHLSAFSAVAHRFPDFSFGYISAEKFGGNMERMGASGKVIPTVVRLVFSQNKPIAYDREGDFSEQSIQEWVEGTVSGKYKYQPKSEAIPEANDNPVKTIVGTTFEEIVHDEGKDVLVEFYAPWCGHCKTLVPEYEKLATSFKENDKIVIGKIDLTANDVDTSHYEVKGFPTILLYKRGHKKNPLPYQGKRDAASIEAWIKENVSDSAETKKDEL